MVKVKGPKINISLKTEESTNNNLNNNPSHHGMGSDMISIDGSRAGLLASNSAEGSGGSGGSTPTALLPSWKDSEPRYQQRSSRRIKSGGNGGGGGNNSYIPDSMMYAPPPSAPEFNAMPHLSSSGGGNGRLGSNNSNNNTSNNNSKRFQMGSKRRSKQNFMQNNNNNNDGDPDQVPLASDGSIHAMNFDATASQMHLDPPSLVPGGGKQMPTVVTGSLPPIMVLMDPMVGVSSGGGGEGGNDKTTTLTRLPPPPPKENSNRSMVVSGSNRTLMNCENDDNVKSNQMDFFGGGGGDDAAWIPDDSEGAIITHSKSTPSFGFEAEGSNFPPVDAAFPPHSFCHEYEEESKEAMMGGSTPNSPREGGEGGAWRYRTRSRSRSRGRTGGNDPFREGGGDDGDSGAMGRSYSFDSRKEHGGDGAGGDREMRRTTGRRASADGATGTSNAFSSSQHDVEQSHSPLNRSGPPSDRRRGRKSSSVPRSIQNGTHNINNIDDTNDPFFVPVTNTETELSSQWTGQSDVSAPTLSTPSTAMVLSKEGSQRASSFFSDTSDPFLSTQHTGPAATPSHQHQQQHYHHQSRHHSQRHNNTTSGTNELTSQNTGPARLQDNYGTHDTAMREARKELKQSIRKSKLDKIAELKVENKDLKGSLKMLQKENRARMDELSERDNWHRVTIKAMENELFDAGITISGRTRDLLRQQKKSPSPSSNSTALTLLDDDTNKNNTLPDSNNTSTTSRDEAFKALAGAAHKSNMTLVANKVKLDEVEREYEKLKRKMSELKNQNSSLELRTLSAEKENQTLKTEVDGLQRELTRSMESVEEMENERNDDKTRIIAMSRELDGHRARTKDVEWDAYGKGEQIRRFEEQMARKDAELEAAKVDLRDNTERHADALLAKDVEIATLKSDAEDKTNKLKGATDDLNTLRADFAERDQRCQQLQESLREAEEAAHTAEQTLAEMKQSHSETTQQDTAATEALKAELEKTKAELSKALEQFEFYKTVRVEADERRSSELRKAQDSVSQSEEARLRMEAEVEYAKSDRDLALAELEEVQTKLTDVKGEVDRKGGEMKDILTDLKDTKEKMETLEDENGKLKGELEILQNQINGKDPNMDFSTHSTTAPNESKPTKRQSRWGSSWRAGSGMLPPSLLSSMSTEQQSEPLDETAIQLKEKDIRIESLELKAKEAEQKTLKLKSDLVKTTSCYKDLEYTSRMQVKKLQEENTAYAMKVAVLEKEFRIMNYGNRSVHDKPAPDSVRDAVEEAVGRAAGTGVGAGVGAVGVDLDGEDDDDDDEVEKDANDGNEEEEDDEESDDEEEDSVEGETQRVG